MGQAMDAFRRLRNRLAPPAVDHEALRDEMSRTDPAFRLARDVYHDAKQALTAKRLADGLAVRREAEFWRKHPQ